MDSEFHLTDGSVLVRPYQSSDVKSLYEAVRELALRDRLTIHDRTYDAVVFSLVRENLTTRKSRTPA